MCSLTRLSNLPFDFGGILMFLIGGNINIPDRWNIDFRISGLFSVFEGSPQSFGPLKLKTLLEKVDG